MFSSFQTREMRFKNKKIDDLSMNSLSTRAHKPIIF